MKEIFDISINIDNVNEIVTNDKIVKMISFTGDCNSEYFVGDVMPGGIDVQVIDKNGSGTISARYILMGMDYLMIPCNVYIDNTGIIEHSGGIKTNPKIITDSEGLGWLQSVKLSCDFVTENNVLHIKIYS